jgi:hypothetical protein
VKNHGQDGRATSFDTEFRTVPCRGSGLGQFFRFCATLLRFAQNDGSRIETIPALVAGQMDRLRQWLETGQNAQVLLNASVGMVLEAVGTVVCRGIRHCRINRYHPTIPHSSLFPINRHYHTLVMPKW